MAGESRPLSCCDSNSRPVILRVGELLRVRRSQNIPAESQGFLPRLRRKPRSLCMSKRVSRSERRSVGGVLDWARRMSERKKIRKRWDLGKARAIGGMLVVAAAAGGGGGGGEVEVVVLGGWSFCVFILYSRCRVENLGWRTLLKFTSLVKLKKK